MKICMALQPEAILLVAKGPSKSNENPWTAMSTNENLWIAMQSKKNVKTQMRNMRKFHNSWMRSFMQSLARFVIEHVTWYLHLCPKWPEKWPQKWPQKWPLGPPPEPSEATPRRRGSTRAREAQMLIKQTKNKARNRNLWGKKDGKRDSGAASRACVCLYTSTLHSVACCMYTLMLVTSS